MSKKEEKELKNIPLEELTLENCTFMDKSLRKIKSDGPLDSMEEWYLTCYFKELISAGVIIDADKNVAAITLGDKVTHLSTEYMKTKTKPVFRHMLYPAAYTPDFNVKWSPEWKDVIFSLFNSGKNTKGHKVPFISCKSNMHSSIFECKGGFTKGAETQIYALLLKWVYEKYRIYIQKVKVPDLFKETFTPQAYIDDMTYKVANQNKKIKPGDSRLKYKPVSCLDYLASIKDKKPKQQGML